MVVRREMEIVKYSYPEDRVVHAKRHVRHDYETEALSTEMGSDKIIRPIRRQL
jgi:hypothetical protein